MSSATAEGLGLGSEIPQTVEDRYHNGLFQVNDTFFVCVGRRVMQIDARKISTPEGSVLMREERQHVLDTLGSPDRTFADQVNCSSLPILLTYYKRYSLGICYVDDAVAKIEVLPETDWFERHRLKEAHPPP